MAWVRCCGGGSQSNFPWGAIAEGNFDKVTARINVAQSDSFITGNKSPKIGSGCILKGTVLGSQYSIVISVSTDKSTWTNVYTASLQTNADFEANLTSYMGLELYFRIYLTNQGGTAANYTLSSCYIDK